MVDNRQGGFFAADFRMVPGLFFAIRGDPQSKTSCRRRKPRQDACPPPAIRVWEEDFGLAPAPHHRREFATLPILPLLFAGAGVAGIRLCPAWIAGISLCRARIAGIGLCPAWIARITGISLCPAWIARITGISLCRAGVAGIGLCRARIARVRRLGLTGSVSRSAEKSRGGQSDSGTNAPNHREDEDEIRPFFVH